MRFICHTPPWPDPLPQPAGSLPPLERAQLALQQPDALLRDERGRGRVSLWWRDVPAWPGHRLGVLGHFAALDREVTAELLGEARRLLALQGCTLAVGPMDGNTWRGYRFMTDDFGEPRFALEPWNPAEWPHWWEAAGFAPFQQYRSALVSRLAPRDPRLLEAERRLADQGVGLRPVNLAEFERELERIFEVSAPAFAENVLYTPLPREEFLAMYRGIKPHVRPPLVRIAERAGRPVGFIFAVPDLLQTQRGGAPDTLIVKTLAKLKQPALSGLGKVMLDQVQRAGERLGFSRSIIALMHDANASTMLGASRRQIRRYTLYARSLA